MFRIFGSKKAAPASHLPPIVYTDTPSYWRATFEREENYYRKIVANADEEISQVHRRDWWQNYPGVGSAVSHNLITGTHLAFAGEWDLAITYIRGRCLPYEFVLSSPEYEERLRANHPGLADKGLAETCIGLGFARSIVEDRLDEGLLRRGFNYYLNDLKNPSDSDLTDWRDQHEFESINAAMIALILGDFEQVQPLFAIMPPFLIHEEYHQRVAQLALNPRDPAQQRSFLAHFEHVRDMSRRPDKWIRPQGCNQPNYSFYCGVLAERIHADWQGVPNWKRVCELIAGL